MKAKEMSDATLAVRRFRERQRERGLVKKDVWIRPEHSARLAQIENDLRTAEGVQTFEHQTWSLDSIEHALLASPLVKSGLLSVCQIEGADPSLRLTVNVPCVLNDEHYVDVLLAVAGDQILVESLLWSAERVVDTDVFNEYVLRTHKFISLASFAMIDVSGTPHYTIFGALDARSSLTSVLLEIQAVAEAAKSAPALYAEFLLPEASHD